MKIIFVLAVASWLVLPAHSDSSKPKSPKLGYAGEGGGYTQPFQDASDAMETGTRQNGAGSNAAAGDDGSPSQHSMLGGLTAPMALSSQKLGEVGEDEDAAVMGRNDYETHILGQRPGVSANAPSAPRPAAPHAAVVDSPVARAQADREVFVALSLDLKQRPDASLKDAVADLGRAAGFRQDFRFAPAAIGVGSGPSQVALWGWMSPARLAEALKVPSVARLQVNSVQAPAASATATKVVLGVRMQAGTAPAQILTDLQKEFAAMGLRVLRPLGTQIAPGTAQQVLVVEASVPISSLDRVMASPNVIQLAAAPGEAPAPVKTGQPLSAELRRFIDFVMSHSPILLIVTALMALPWILSGLTAMAGSFVPYR